MSTSLTENLWQWCVLATPLQQLLGMNVAATNQWTLDVQLVVDAKQNRRGNWVGRQRLLALGARSLVVGVMVKKRRHRVVAVVVVVDANGFQLAVELAVELAVALGARSLVVGVMVKKKRHRFF